MPIVSNPTAGDVHVNTPLTNFAQKYLQSQEMFIGGRAMPNHPVAKQSDLYYTFSRADFFRDEAQERADGTESAGGGFTPSTDPYFARVYAFHKDVTDRQRANQDSVIRLDNSATQFVTQKLLIRRDVLFNTAFFKTGIWGTDVTPSPLWDVATGTPIADVRTAIRTVQGNTGMRPNKMIIGRIAWDALLDSDDLLSRITGGSTVGLPAMVQRQLVAALFEIEEIFVYDSVVNSAQQGATEATGFIGGSKDALVYYAPDSLSLDEPTAGSMFSWTGFMGATENGMRIKRFREERLESDRIEGQMAFDFKVAASELGYFFSTVTA